MSAYNYFGTVSLPDGRKVKVRQEGYFEHDTGGFVETGLVLEWANGDELTAEEVNEDLGDGYYLHEYCVYFLADAPDYNSEPFYAD